MPGMYKSRGMGNRTVNGGRKAAPKNGPAARRKGAGAARTRNQMARKPGMTRGRMR